MSGFAVPVTSWTYNGVPAASGTVDVYRTGTTTHVTIYSDAALSNPISNPLTLNADGYAVFYVATSFNLRLDGKTSTGTLIKSIDPVYVVNDQAGVTATATELNYLHGVTPGTASANLALVVDGTQNVTNLATNTFNTASTGIANMTAVQGSLTGGFVNKFRNPLMDIAQRGTSGSVTTGNTNYTVDGWLVGATGATVNWTQAFGSLQSMLRSYIQLTGNAGMTDTLIKQRIESTIAAPLSNQQVTVQLFLYNVTGATITPTLTVKTANVQDNWGATTTVVNAVSLQPITASSSATLAYTFAAGASAGNGLEVTIDFATGLNSNAKSVYMTYFDIRSTPGVNTGLNSTPPVIEYRPYATELAYCQRYLPAFGAIAGPLGMGFATSTSASGYYIPFRVPTRIAPTALSIATVGNLEAATYANVDTAALTGLTFAQAGPDGAFVTATVTGTPFTSAVAYFLYAKVALAGNLIFTGAEL